MAIAGHKAKRTLGTSLAIVAVMVVALLAQPALGASKITYLTHPTLFQALGGQDAISEFTERTGIEVEVVTMPTPQIREKIMIEFMAGTGSYDVINVSNTIFNTDVAAFLEPLDSFITSDPIEDWDDIFPALVQQFQYPHDGPRYGVPFRSGTTLLFYLESAFDDHGVTVPETWTEWEEATKKLTIDEDGDGKPELYGTATKAGDVHTTSEDFLRFLYAHGGDVLTPDLKDTLLDQPEAIKAAERQAWPSLAGYAPVDVTTWIRDDLIVAQQQGRVAMSIQYSPYYGRITDPEQSPVADQISAVPMPHAPGVTPGSTYGPTWVLSIDRNSRNKDAAWQLIKYLAGKEEQFIMALKHGNGPVRASVFQRPEYREFLGIADSWMMALGASKSTPPHPAYGQMEEVWGQEIISVFLKQKSAESAMKDAATKIRTILRGFR